MVDRLTLQRRLKKLDEYLKILKSLQKFKKPTFLKDPYLHGSAERYLHLAAECMLDVGSHLIATEGMRTPEDYRSIFEILEENKIINSAFSKKLQKWASFRNILVHDYVNLDLEIIYKTIQKDLGDIQKFMKIFAKLAS